MYVTHSYFTSVYGIKLAQRLFAILRVYPVVPTMVDGKLALKVKAYHVDDILSILYERKRKNSLCGGFSHEKNDELISCVENIRCICAAEKAARRD